MNMILLFILPLLVVFPTNQSKTLRKGERWDIGCMDIELQVKETKVKIGKEWVTLDKVGTITCNSANKATATMVCPSNADPDADPPEVLCK